MRFASFREKNKGLCGNHIQAITIKHNVECNTLANSLSVKWESCSYSSINSGINRVISTLYFSRHSSLLCLHFYSFFLRGNMVLCFNILRTVITLNKLIITRSSIGKFSRSKPNHGEYLRSKSPGVKWWKISTKIFNFLKKIKIRWRPEQERIRDLRVG